VDLKWNFPGNKHTRVPQGSEPVRTQGTSKLLAGVNGPCLKSNAFII